MRQRVIIEPARKVTLKEIRLLASCDGEFEEEDYAILDNIPWKYVEGWRNRYPDIPILSHVTH